MKIFYLSLLFFTCAFSSTTEEILKDIESNPNTAAVLIKYSENSADWKIIQNGIRTGDSRWISAYENLRAASDAGNTDDLDLSIVYAIEQNPLAALKAIGIATHPILNCAETDETLFNDSPLKPAQIKNALSHIEVRINKIESVTEKILLPAKQPCLDVLKKSRASLQGKLKKKKPQSKKTEALKKH